MTQRYVFTTDDRQRAAEMRAYHKLFGKPAAEKKPRHEFTAEERHRGGVNGFNATMARYPGNRFLERKIRGWSTPENRQRNYEMHCTAWAS